MNQFCCNIPDKTNVRVWKSLLGAEIIKIPCPVTDFDYLVEKIEETDLFLSAFFSQFYTTDIIVKHVSGNLGTVGSTYKLLTDENKSHELIYLSDLRVISENPNTKGEMVYVLRCELKHGDKMYYLSSDLLKDIEIYTRRNQFETILGAMKWINIGLCGVLFAAGITFLAVADTLINGDNTLFVVVGVLSLILSIFLNFSAMIDVGIFSVTPREEHARLYRDLETYFKSPLKKDKTLES